MGRRKKRRKPTRKEKAQGHDSKVKAESNGGRGRIGFGDLSPMTQKVVADIAMLQRCTKEEIVEVLNQ